jgi:hypothetical protein
LRWDWGNERTGECRGRGYKQSGEDRVGRAIGRVLKSLGKIFRRGLGRTRDASRILKAAWSAESLKAASFACHSLLETLGRGSGTFHFDPLSRCGITRASIAHQKIAWSSCLTCMATHILRNRSGKPQPNLVEAQTGNRLTFARCMEFHDFMSGEKSRAGTNTQ